MFRSRLATAASFGRGLEFRRPVTVRVWQIFMKIWSLCLDVDDWPITLKARDLRGTRPQPRLPRAGLATHSRKNVSTKVAFCFLFLPFSAKVRSYPLSNTVPPVSGPQGFFLFRNSFTYSPFSACGSAGPPFPGIFPYGKSLLFGRSDGVLVFLHTATYMPTSGLIWVFNTFFWVH